jgi:hypothetical protein
MFVLAGFPVAVLSGFEIPLGLAGCISQRQLHSCCSLMDKHTLLQHFHYIISLSSLAYIFTAVHTIQYAMWDHNNNDTSTQDHSNPSSHSASTSTHNTQPATTSTSESNKKASGRWTDDEIKLLLDYVESNCTLTTARGLTLKKSEFNKASTTVKSKDATQCHYKWGQVRILIINYGFHRLSGLQLCSIYKAISQWDKKSGAGWHDDYGANARTPSEKEVFADFLKTPEVSTTLISLVQRSVSLTLKKAYSTQSLHDETLASLPLNAGIHARYPASRNPCV